MERDSRNLPLLPIDGGEAHSTRDGDEATKEEPKAPCSGLAQGSLYGTCFNMCAAIMGAGSLSLPHAISSMGVVPGCLLLVLTAIATHASVVFLIRALDATGARSFEDLSVLVFGARTGHVVEGCIIVFQFGTLVAYTVAIGDILDPFVKSGWVASQLPWLSRDLVIVFFWLLFMLPLSLVERISSLQAPT
jgi:amino acid permease